VLCVAQLCRLHLATWHAPQHACVPEVHACTAVLAATLLLRCAQLPADEAPAVLLALLWASLSNVSAAAFWTVAFLLLPEHARFKGALLNDLLLQPELGTVDASECQSGDAQHACGPDAKSVCRQRVLRAGAADDSLLQCCVDEAIRLRAEGVRLASDWHLQSTGSASKLQLRMQRCACLA
jgi:hypothetical protein